MLRPKGRQGRHEATVEAERNGAGGSPFDGAIDLFEVTLEDLVYAVAPEGRAVPAE